MLKFLVIVSIILAIFAVILCQDFSSVLQGIQLNPDANLDIYELLDKYGYPLETHFVQTDDGYILALHRLPFGRNRTDADRRNNKPVILMMQGMFCSSMDYVNTGPGRALGLILAEAKYDVWLGNNRGTRWSRNHIKLNPDTDPEFWDFSFDTMGEYDLPAMIDYILKTTSQKNLIYIGFSQGITQFLAMASLKPKYNNKITVAVLMAPIAYTAHISSPLLRPILNNMNTIKEILNKFNIQEILGYNHFMAKILSWIVSDGSPLQQLATHLVFLIYGYDKDQLNKTMLPVLVSNFPAGASAQMAYHIAQISHSDNFTRYDYGKEKNVKIYGRPNPPKFNLSAVTTPVALYYAKNDFLAAYEDVVKLSKELPNVIKNHTVNYTNFNHIDFLVAKDVSTLLYNDIRMLIYNYTSSKDIDITIAILPIPGCALTKSAELVLILALIGILKSL